MPLACRRPLLAEMAVLAHQAHLGSLAVGAELARGVNSEQHCFVLALVGAELFIPILDKPFVAVPDDEVTGCRHGPSQLCGHLELTPPPEDGSGRPDDFQDQFCKKRRPSVNAQKGLRKIRLSGCSRCNQIGADTLIIWGGASVSHRRTAAQLCRPLMLCAMRCVQPDL